MKDRLLAGAALSVTLTVLGSMPAAAADPLLFSSDGDQWTSDLAAPIFAQTPVLVPGDEASASFWVRNASGDPASLKVALAMGWPTAGEDLGGLWVRAELDDEPVIADGGPDEVLLALDGMDALDSRKVTVTVGLDAAAGNSSQNEKLPMSFDVRLTQSVPDPAPDGDSGPPTPGAGFDDPAQPNDPSVPGHSEPRPETSPGRLAETGFTALWVAAAGAALAAGGFLTLAWGRKTKKSTSEEGGHGAA